MRNGKPECECGQPKDPQAKACIRCMHLDGTMSADATVIAIIREFGGAASTAQIEMRYPAVKRNILKHLQGLVAAGRVRREVRGNGEIRGTEPTWILVEMIRQAPEPEHVLERPGAGQLAIVAPRMSATCPHRRIDLAVSFAGVELALQCRSCLRVLLTRRFDEPTAPAQFAAGSSLPMESTT